MRDKTFGLGCCLVLTLGVALAAPAPQLQTDTIKERDSFIPHRKYFSLPGKTIGILAGDVREMMGQEGRSGPPKAYGFSAAGGSYRWVYTPAQDKSIIQNLQVAVGENGNRIKVYPALNMADPDTVKPWKIDAPYALVEVEVNDAQGAPPDEGFVATKMTRLDGTREYPLNLPDVVADGRKRYQRFLDEQATRIEDGLAEAVRKHLKGEKPTGPRETRELFYITWLPDQQVVRMHFRTQVTEGALVTGRGGRQRPLPRPAPAVNRPALNARFGKLIGVELGLAIEVTRTGKVDRVLTLPIEPIYQAFVAPAPILQR